MIIHDLLCSHVASIEMLIHGDRTVNRSAEQNYMQCRQYCVFYGPVFICIFMYILSDVLTDGETWWRVPAAEDGVF